MFGNPGTWRKSISWVTWASHVFPGLGGWFQILPKIDHLKRVEFGGTRVWKLKAFNSIYTNSESRWWFHFFLNVHPYLGKIPILTHIFQWVGSIFFIFMFIPIWGRFPFWLIFFNGLVQPPTSYLNYFEDLDSWTFIGTAKFQCHIGVS